MIQHDRSEQRLQLRRMRQVSLVEGATLVVLIFHRGAAETSWRLSGATADHGADSWDRRFVAYVWMLSQDCRIR